jgi:hypothetical protein
MTNILGDDKRADVLALGRLGWTLRRIEQATGVRRETASAYLKAAGIAVRDPRHRRLAAANPASEVSTDPGARPPGIPDLLSLLPPPGRAPAASACAPYRELIAGVDAIAILRKRRRGMWRPHRVIVPGGSPSCLARVPAPMPAPWASRASPTTSARNSTGTGRLSEPCRDSGPPGGSEVVERGRPSCASFRWPHDAATSRPTLDVEWRGVTLMLPICHS